MDLPASEFALLEALATRAGRVVRRDDLADRLGRGARAAVGYGDRSVRASSAPQVESARAQSAHAARFWLPAGDTRRMDSASLRLGLLLRLGGALVLLLALDAVASYFTALHFANLVYDRWLIDSTHSLAQAVRASNGKAVFDLTAVGLEVFQFRRGRQDLLSHPVRAPRIHCRRGGIALERAVADRCHSPCQRAPSTAGRCGWCGSASPRPERPTS